MLIGKDSER